MHLFGTLATVQGTTVRVAVWSALALALAAASCSSSASTGHSSSTTLSRPADSARKQFLALAARSRSATWKEEGSLTRRFTDRRKAPTARFGLTQVQRPPDTLVLSGGTLTGQLEGKSVNCSAVKDTKLCAPSGAAPSYEDQRVKDISSLITITDPDEGWYHVAATHPGTRIVGETAQCFTLKLTDPKKLAVFALATEYCYARDGVPLRTTTTRASSVDEQLPTKVTRKVTINDFNALINKYRGEGSTPRREPDRRGA